MSSLDPRVTIVLVTYNALEATRELINAIRAFTRQPYELVVVDNASTDGTLEYLRQQDGSSGYTLIANPTNVQCAAATNQAIARVTTEYVIYLCSSHALVSDSGWDEALVRFLDERPSIGLAGCVWNPYGFALPSKRYRDGWTPERFGRDRLRHVQGGAWIARRSVFENYGSFAADEYPHGGMDVEFSYRLLSHGEKLGHCSAITAPPYPAVPQREAGVFVYHPASDALRRDVRSRLAGNATRTASAGGRGWGSLG